MRSKGTWLHLGQSQIVPGHRVIGIFDLDKCSTSKRTRDFLAAAEEEGVVLERKTKGETLPPAFQRLQNVVRDLEALIRRSKNRPNKDLADLANQLHQVISKWEG